MGTRAVQHFQTFRAMRKAGLGCSTIFAETPTNLRNLRSLGDSTSDENSFENHNR